MIIKILCAYMFYFIYSVFDIKKIVILLANKLYPENEHINYLSIRHFNCFSHWFLHWKAIFKNPV
jgi:hypothetical protein